MPDDKDKSGYISALEPDRQILSRVLKEHDIVSSQRKQRVELLHKLETYTTSHPTSAITRKDFLAYARQQCGRTSGNITSGLIHFYKVG